jgi:hypothetical protein
MEPVVDQPPPLSTSKTVYRWTRDLHCYAGLFLSPFLLVYALSTVFLNHAFLPWGERRVAVETKSAVRLSLPQSENSLDLAKSVRRELGIVGEIGYVNYRPKDSRLSFPIERPGHAANVRVDLATMMATVESRETGVWDGLIYLHRMPGPHNVAIRGNWIITRYWGWLADVTVYLLLFLTASGVYLWTVLKADRRTGLLFLGSGVAAFVALVGVIVL